MISRALYVDAEGDVGTSIIYHIHRNVIARNDKPSGSLILIVCTRFHRDMKLYCYNNDVLNLHNF